MFRLPRRKLRAGGGKSTPAHLSTPVRTSRTSTDKSPPMGGSKSQGRWRSAPEVEDLGGIIGTREQVLAAIQLQRWRRRCPTHAQSWDAASDDHEVHGLAAEVWQATAEGTTNEDQLHDPARAPSQHERRHGLPTQREAEGEGERGQAAREGSSRERECGSSECDEMGSGLSTPSTADAAQSTPTTPPMPSRPDHALSPACAAGGAIESCTIIPSPHPTDSHPSASYHSERCAESGKLHSLCACAACAAPQAAARRERNNERCAAAWARPEPAHKPAPTPAPELAPASRPRLHLEIVRRLRSSAAPSASAARNAGRWHP